MASDIVQDQFYYGGRIHAVGDPIEVENAADRKSLQDRGLIGDGKALPTAPENKIVVGATDTKAADAKTERRIKA